MLIAYPRARSVLRSLLLALLLRAPGIQAQAPPTPPQLDPQLVQELTELAIEFNHACWRNARRQLARSALPVYLYARSINAAHTALIKEDVRRGLTYAPDSLPWPPVRFQGRVLPDIARLERNEKRMHRALHRIYLRHRRDDYRRLDQLLRQQQPLPDSLLLYADSAGNVREVQHLGEPADLREEFKRYYGLRSEEARDTCRPDALWFRRESSTQLFTATEIVPIRNQFKREYAAKHADTAVLAVLHRQGFRLRGVYKFENPFVEGPFVYTRWQRSAFSRAMRAPLRVIASVAHWARHGPLRGFYQLHKPKHWSRRMWREHKRRQRNPH